MRLRIPNPFVHKNGATLDLLAKRYGKTPSEYVGYDKVYSPYYCLQFDLACAIRGISLQAKAQKEAYAEAERKAREESSPFGGGGEGDSKDASPLKERFETLGKNPHVSKEKMSSEEIFKKISGLWQNKRNDEPSSPSS